LARAGRPAVQTARRARLPVLPMSLPGLRLQAMRACAHEAWLLQCVDVSMSLCIQIIVCGLQNLVLVQGLHWRHRHVQ